VKPLHQRAARLVLLTLIGTALAVMAFIGTVDVPPIELPPGEEPAAEEPTAAQQAPDCNPNYTPCVPNDPVDMDCEGGGGDGPSYVRGPVQVIGEDVRTRPGRGAWRLAVKDGTGGAATPPPSPVRAPARFTG
jgi:hypothetical protein